MKVKLKSKEDASEFSLLYGKEYNVESVENGYYRIIDEDIDDTDEPRGYLYSDKMFDIIKQPK